MKTMQWNTGIHRGLPHTECLDCRVDYLGEHAQAKMRHHCEHTGHGMSEECGLAEVRQTALSNGPIPVTITLGYLCWNTAKASAEGMLALLDEAARLRELGAKVSIYAVDNGSTDETLTQVYDAICHHPELRHTCTTMLPLAKNEGISNARNRILEWAVSGKSDYVLLMDGDIEVVPYSVYHMVRYLRCHHEVGCIGAYSANWTKAREGAAKVLTNIPESRVRTDIRCAWTQYGLFRGSMFQAGMRFETEGVFGLPGWGFEDDDLFFQMHVAGWKNCYFGNMCYLHRGLHSSWGELAQIGVSVKAMYAARKAHLLDKWKGTKLDSAILNLVRAQGLPTLPE